MDRKKVILLAIVLRRRRRRQAIKSQRRYWVHPILRVRYVEGAFYTLFEKLKANPAKFFNYFRMSRDTFDYLVDRIKESICLQDTQMRECVPPTEMVAVTLRYLASGNTFTDLHYTYRLGITTIRRIVRKVCLSIWSILHEQCIPTPNKERWIAIAEEFKRKAHFPHCIGAVDGKHIRVRNFPGSGSMNLNYKSFFSIVLLAIVDADYRFVYIDVGAYGKNADSSIFQQTDFWMKLQDGTLDIPLASLVTPTIQLPYVLVGDEAFSQTTFLLRPYGRRTDLDDKKKIFNYRLCRARRYVECGFGILSNKWRIFHRALNVGKTFSRDIVKACIVLHNLVRDRDGQTSDYDYYVSEKGFQDLPQTAPPRGGRRANDLREHFSDYFVSTDGSLPWQMSKI